MRTVLTSINFALVVTVGAAIGSTSTSVLEHYLMIHTRQGVKQPSTTQLDGDHKKLPYQKLNPFLERNLFKVERSAKIEPLAISDAPGSSTVAAAEFNLILQGVWVLGEKSFAFITTPNAPQEKVYQKEECIPSKTSPPSKTCSAEQAKLIAIDRQSVLVRFQGKDLRFEVNHKNEGKQNQQAIAATMPTVPITGAETAPAATGSAERFAASQEGNRMEVKVPNQEVTNAFQNLAQILQDARVIPFTSGEVQGFQIREIVPDSVFDKLHLQNFDVLQEVNGESLTTADKALNLFTAFRNEKQITLKLIRDNQPVTLQYDIQ